MITLAICSGLLAIGVIGIIFLDKWDHEGLLTLSWISAVICGLFVIGTLIGIPIKRNDVQRDIQRLEAFRQTVQSSRASKMNDLERVAFLKEVAQWNERLAATKYDNKHYWDWWIPDEIENVEPIR